VSDENEYRNDGEWNSLLALGMTSFRRFCEGMTTSFAHEGARTKDVERAGSSLKVDLPNRPTSLPQSLSPPPRLR
jgi:hypothetical protein